MTTSRAAFPVLLVILVFVLVACQGVGLAPDNLREVPVDGTTVGRDGDLGGAPAPDEAGGVTGVQPEAAQADRSIIRTGEITVEVENVPATVGEVRALALELDGYVSSSFQGEFEESATLTLRIPADRFEDAIAAIHELDGEVKAEATREEDVTAAVIDIEARLENLRAAEEEYRALLDRAETVEDILAIQNQLFAVRGEIEAYEAQLAYYTDQVDMATLTVSVIPVPEPVTAATEDFDPAAIAEEAVAALVSFGQWLVSAGIWLLIVGLPVLGVVAVLAVVGWRLVRRLRPPRPPQAPPAEMSSPA